jgi:two-component system, chemotaxis family, chemotaxis protein CheY
MQPQSTKSISMTKVSNIRSAPKFRQTVLLIDDQPTVLDIHAAIIKSLKMDLKIVTMTDPVEALAWLQNKQVDLIITDFRMHHMDGMQFVQALKNADNVLAHAIVVVTVLKEHAIHQELIAAGASACLTKPVQTNELAKIAKTLLEQSKQYYGLGLIS